MTECFNRVRAAGATGPIILRADSGFYSRAVIDAADNAGATWSVTVKMSKRLHAVISAIPEADWTPIPYWIDGGADVAETTRKPFGRSRSVRLIVRRTKPTPGSQLALPTTYDHHAFITNRDGDMLVVEADHRAHARIEAVIRGWQRAVPRQPYRFSGDGSPPARGRSVMRWRCRPAGPGPAPPFGACA